MSKSRALWHSSYIINDVITNRNQVSYIPLKFYFIIFDCIFYNYVQRNTFRNKKNINNQFWAIIIIEKINIKSISMYNYESSNNSII